MSKKAKGFNIVAFENLDDMVNDMEQSNKLYVVDAFKDWCGPTVVMEPALQRIFVATEDALERLCFCTVDRSLLKGHPGLSKAPLSAELMSTCRPLYLLFKGKRLVGKVIGANAPDISQVVHDVLIQES